MGKIPDELRETIARNIRNCRKKKFPGRGGGKKCAEDFGVSPQQWSPWETGKRTPDELRLKQIADFFAVTVEFMRRDNRIPHPIHESIQEEQPERQSDIPTSNQISGIDVPPPPGWQPAPPGSPASFFWLARYFVTAIQSQGMRFDKQCLEYLAELLKTPHP